MYINAFELNNEVSKLKTESEIIMDCLVSVIIPVYMVQDYVEKSILSVMNQTYHNIELICIDDASTDRSRIICEKLAQKYRNIKVLRHIVNGEYAKNNLRQEAMRNLGLDNTSGDYCIFLDPGDTFLPEAIETMARIAVNNDANIVMCGYSKIINESDYPR